MKYAAALVSLFALGCNQIGPEGAKGEPGPPGPAGESAVVEGERLLGRWEAGDDGSRVFQGWYDSKLKTNCHFRHAADGIIRCLPDMLTPFTENDRPVVLFSDPACQVPVLGFSELCTTPAGAAPTYATYTESSACGGVHVRAVKGPIPAPSDLYGWSAGDCLSMPAMPGPFFDLEDETEPAAFLQGGTALSP